MLAPRRIFFAPLRDRVVGLAVPTTLLMCSAIVALGVLIAPRSAQADSIAGDGARCLALRDTDFSFIPDAPAQIIATKSITADAAQPGFCEVSGYVAPSVGFVLRLPANGWNGKMVQVACGAFCGSTNDQLYAFTCRDPLRRGYACIVSDNGHKSWVADGLWAHNNLQAMVDQAYRGPHVAALAGKDIVKRYYNTSPRKSYFLGCSNGGRQGLMAAQRFPLDFDGIVAGDPELSPPEHFMSLLWANRALTDSAGRALLSKGDLESIHEAVVNRCDLNDGLKDNLIGDPRLCPFDVKELACSDGKSARCLSPTQIDAVQKLYAGPMTSTGERIYLPSALPGSERNWGGFVNPASFSNRYLREYFRYMAFQPAAGPTWNPQDFDFDRDPRRQSLAGALNSTTNPDLRAFKAAGGKLISYTGWNDVDVTPLSIVNYYETVERTMGGRVSTQDFFRLFVLPGLNHCYGGDGASQVDYLSYLEAWVERGQAPDKLIGFHVTTDDLKPADVNDLETVYAWKRRREFPLDPSFVTFSRPVYPYPIRVRYLKRGDPNDAGSFGPEGPGAR